MARQSKVSRAAAADELDRVVHDILRSLRRGVPVKLPGLGVFKPGEKVDFQFDGSERRTGKKK